MARLRRAKLPAHWPLSLFLVGYPLWWVLGLTAIVPVFCAAAMLVQLSRQPRVHLPRGFLLWLLFLIWASMGALLVFADAPGTVPGGGPNRLIVFGYRFGTYLVATVFLVWMANVSRRVLSDRRLHQFMAWLFVVTVAGGMVGILLPTLQFRSPMELILPGGLRTNALVRSLTHPAVAEVQTVLGRPEARPQAPYPYSNTWGSMLALLLPFFVVAVARAHSRRLRIFGAVTLIVALVPVMYSLNRGLWICLVLGMVGVVLLVALRSRPAVLMGTAVATMLGIIVFMLSPLGALLQERLDNQHSNERRGELASKTVEITVEGSPLVGFGGTRDVQGNFTSIAGGSTPDCQSCGVPPLGTQGMIWSFIFIQGFVGAALALAFLSVALARSWRCRTRTETICTFVLAFTGVQLLVYDLNGVPLITIMIAYAAVARQQRLDGRDRMASGLTWARLTQRAHRARWVLTTTTVIGLVTGAVLALTSQPTYSTRVSLLLAPSPVSLVSQVLDAETRPEEVTRDTEAALVLSQASLARVVGNDVAAIEDLRERVTITVAPNTTVLTIEIRANTSEASRREADALAASYLETRRLNLETSRDQLLSLIGTQVIQLESAASQLASTGRVDAIGRNEAERQESLVALKNAQIALQLTRTTAGEVVQDRNPVLLPRRWEVPLASGIALGFLVGVGGAYLVVRPRRRRRRTPTNRQVERELTVSGV